MPIFPYKPGFDYTHSGGSGGGGTVIQPSKWYTEEAFENQSAPVIQTNENFPYSFIDGTKSGYAVLAFKARGTSLDDLPLQVVSIYTDTQKSWQVSGYAVGLGGITASEESMVINAGRDVSISPSLQMAFNESGDQSAYYVAGTVALTMTYKVNNPEATNIMLQREGVVRLSIDKDQSILVSPDNSKVIKTTDGGIVFVHGETNILDSARTTNSLFVRRPNSDLYEIYLTQQYSQFRVGFANVLTLQRSLQSSWLMPETGIKFTVGGAEGTETFNMSQTATTIKASDKATMEMDGTAIRFQRGTNQLLSMSDSGGAMTWNSVIRCVWNADGWNVSRDNGVAFTSRATYSAQIGPNGSRFETNNTGAKILSSDSPTVGTTVEVTNAGGVSVVSNGLAVAGLSKDQISLYVNGYSILDANYSGDEGLTVITSYGGERVNLLTGRDGAGINAGSSSIYLAKDDAVQIQAPTSFIVNLGGNYGVYADRTKSEITFNGNKVTTDTNGTTVTGRLFGTTDVYTADYRSAGQTAEVIDPAYLLEWSKVHTKMIVQSGNSVVGVRWVAEDILNAFGSEDIPLALGLLTKISGSYFVNQTACAAIDAAYTRSRSGEPTVQKYYGLVPALNKDAFHKLGNTGLEVVIRGYANGDMQVGLIDRSAPRNISYRFMSLYGGGAGDGQYNESYNTTGSTFFIDTLFYGNASESQTIHVCDNGTGRIWRAELWGIDRINRKYYLQVEEITSGVDQPYTDYSL